MKLTFFLIAFFLVLLSVYFKSVHGNDNNDGTMTISGDNYYEQIKWSGKVILSEDEKTIAGISPGGYLRFRENDRKLSAESNLQGEISYELYDGHENLILNDSGKRFVADILKKMIAFGFQSEGRPERIYKKGGKKALLDEIQNITLDDAKRPYLDMFFKSDSLTKDDLAYAIRQINGWENSEEKIKCLDRFSADQLKDRTLAMSWLRAAGNLYQDDRKSNILIHFLDNVELSGDISDTLLSITSYFQDDHEKGKILTRLTEKGFAPSGGKEKQWISLIDQVAQIGQDQEKSNLLVLIAQKMPKTGDTKAAYLKAAKTITNDSDYGKAMRAVE